MLASHRRDNRRRICPTPALAFHSASPSSTDSMRGIGGVVVLHRLVVAAHAVVARAALAERDIGATQGSAPAHTRHARRGSGSFDGDRRRGCLREAVIAGPIEFQRAALGRDREERDERVGGDRRIELGAENLLAVIGADEIRDDVARDDWPTLPWRKPVSITCEISVLISMTSPRLALGGTLMRVRRPSDQVLEAGGDRDDDVGLVRPERAVAHSPMRDHRLRVGEPDAGLQLGLAGARTERR